jgi:serine phosphatase RsbU (regulator of sigma subunit)
MFSGFISFLKKRKEIYLRRRREEDNLEKYGGLLFALLVMAIMFFIPENDRRHLWDYVSVFAIFFIAFMYRRIRNSRQQLREKNREIEAQKHIIEEHRKEIIDSINYAKRIQDAILNQSDHVNESLTGTFILYKPKDIVAGDFYWIGKTGNTFLIAAADCTGHGVPGAMVSVICNNALNRAVKEFQLVNTGAILDKTTDLVLETFEKSSHEVKDGMDISLLSIDPVNKKICWSGANNPLWYFDGTEMKEITADKQPVGKSFERKRFTTHEIEHKPGATFYLFTDGYADQFGGPKGKKLMYKRFREILITSLHEGMDIQKQKLNDAFEKWKAKSEQVDDVCVIGIRI